MIFLVGIAIFAPYLPFIILTGRPSEEDRKMRQRFAAIQSGIKGIPSARSDVDLLKNAEEHRAGLLHFSVERLSTLLQLETMLLRAGSQWTPKVVFRFCISAALGAGFVTALATGKIMWGSLAFAAGAITPVLFVRQQAKRRTAAMDRLLPEISDMIARALRAGHSISAALGIVAEESPEPACTAFTEVFQKQRFGLPLRDALLELVRCFPSQDLKVLVTAILVQRDTGGNLVQILERTSTVIRERQKLEGDVRVHTAQGRMTGMILCVLPVLMLGALTLTNPSYPKVLIYDPLGRKLLYAGIVLLALGGLIIQRIVKGIEV